MAKKRRQLVLMGGEGSGGAGGGGGAARPLGSLRALRDALAMFNTSGDGSGADGAGLERLHGPGMVIEIPTSVDPVTQAIATINDEDYAFPVLMKMCKKMGWKMMDIETGRVFG